MTYTLRSFGLKGIAGYGVAVECALLGGLPAFELVGLPDTAVREARERVRSATISAMLPTLPPSALPRQAREKVHLLKRWVFAVRRLVEM